MSIEDTAYGQTVPLIEAAKLRRISEAELIRLLRSIGCDALNSGVGQVVRVKDLERIV